MNACKSFVPGTGSGTHPDSRRPRAAPPVRLKRPTPSSRWCVSHCAPGEMPTARTQLKPTAQGENAELVCNPMNFSLNSKSLRTLCSPYKKGHFKMEFRWSVRVRTRHVLISPAMCIKRHKDSVPVAADWVW